VDSNEPELSPKKQKVKLTSDREQYREHEHFRARKRKAKSEIATISITALDHGTASHPSNIKLLIDSGESKTLLSEADWKKIKPLKGNPKLKLKKNKTISHHLEPT